MKKYNSQIWLGIMCIILGIMVSFQFKNANSPSTAANTRKIEDLVKEVENLKNQRDELAKKVSEAEKKLNEVETNYAASDTIAQSMKEELDLLRKLTGKTEVKGEGIKVTLNMSKGLDTNVGSNINEYDIISIVNELNTAKAEAISINGERVTSRTSIRSAGPAIKINGNPYDPFKEFVIYAIGNPKDLENSLTITGGVRDMLEELGVKIEITPEREIVIPGSKGVFEPKYMK